MILFILSRDILIPDGMLSYLLENISLNSLSLEGRKNLSWHSFKELISPHGNILVEEKHKFDCFFGNSSSSKLLSFRCREKLLLSNNSRCWLKISTFSCQNISCAKDNCFSSSSSTSTSSSIFVFSYLFRRVLEVGVSFKEKRKTNEMRLWRIRFL